MTIYVELIGQLGNQMFQYAAASAQADRLGTKVIPVIEAQARRRLLAHATGRLEPQLYKAFPALRGRLYARGLSAMRAVDPRGSSFRHHRTAIFTPPMHGPDQSEVYSDAIWSIDRGCLLSGFFQSTSYWPTDPSFAERLFTFDDTDVVEARGALETLPSPPSEMVAVHIRLTDYLGQHGAHAGANGWVLPREYFDRALAPYPDLPIALFSDDIERATSMLPRPPAWRSIGNPRMTDLIAMSMFRRLIISNSTFSWWAAKLNSAASPEITAPMYFIGWRDKVWYPRDIKVEGWRYV